MDAIYVGIDVSKDRLDVHVRPSREAFAVARDGKGLEESDRRFETIAAGLREAGVARIATPLPTI